MPAVADRAVTYSNPLGSTLTPIRENVWWGEREFYPRIPGLSQFDVACKMAVVRLRDGSLWVHAPVALDAATKAAVDALGPVRHVVTPNTEHLKWARQWIDAYPEATSYCCPGLREKRPDIGYDLEVGDACPEAWGGEFECTWVEEERAPFGAGQESDIPNFKGSDLGRFPLVSADFWTSDHLSERSRRVDAFPGTRARGTLTLKRT